MFYPQPQLGRRRISGPHSGPARPAKDLVQQEAALAAATIPDVMGAVNLLIGQTVASNNADFERIQQRTRELQRDLKKLLTRLEI